MDQHIRLEIYKSLGKYSDDKKASVHTWIVTNSHYGALRYLRSRRLVRGLDVKEGYYEPEYPLLQESPLDEILSHSDSCKRFFTEYLECDSNFSSLARKYEIPPKLVYRAFSQYKYMLTMHTNRIIRAHRVRARLLKSLTHLNDFEAAMFLCVTHETVNRWRNKYPQFKKQVQFNRNNIEKVLKGDLERKDLGISSRKWAYWKWRYLNNTPRK